MSDVKARTPQGGLLEASQIGQLLPSLQNFVPKRQESDLPELEKSAFPLLTQPRACSSTSASTFLVDSNMKTRSVGSRAHFSWLIFAVCMVEVVLWSAPPVFALASSGHSVVTGDLYRDHMLKDKDHYVHANGLNREVEVDQPGVDAIKRLLEQEARVRHLGKPKILDLAIPAAHSPIQS